jgi:hypothetical protein
VYRLWTREHVAECPCTECESAVDLTPAGLARRRTAIDAVALAIGEPAEDVDLDVDVSGHSVILPCTIVTVRGVRITGEREERAMDALRQTFEARDGSPGRRIARDG